MNKDISINIDTIKRHAKRLHKILKEDNIVTPDFKLSQSQELLSKALGCNNWFELNEHLKIQEQNKNTQTFSHPLFKDSFLTKLMQTQTWDDVNALLNKQNSHHSIPASIVPFPSKPELPLYNPDVWLSQSELAYSEYRQEQLLLNNLDEDEMTNLLWRLLPKQTNIIFRHFIKALSWVLVYFKKHENLDITVEHINQFKDLKLFYMLYGRFDYPETHDAIHFPYYPHKIALEDIHEFKELVDNYSMLLCGKTIDLDGLNEDLIRQHLNLWANLIEPLQTLKKLEQQDIIVLDKHWTQLLYSVHDYFYQKNAYLFFQETTQLPLLPMTVIKEFIEQPWYHELWFDLLDLDFVRNNDMRVKNSSNTVFSIFKYNQNQRILGLRELVLMLASLVPNEKEIEIISYFITHFSKIKKISLALQAFYQKLDDTNKPLIMVIDDSKTIRQTLDLFLSSHYRVILAENAEQALSILKYKLIDNIMPDIIFCDSNMPVFHEGIEDKNSFFANGYLFVKHYLATHENFSTIPVVFMDHDESNSTVMEENNHNGQYSLVMKPLSKEMIYTAIANILNTVV
jgi:CheY-like chemotaxis protein